VLAVDGRSNSGKTTAASRIGKLVPGAVVIHTDDIAFEHSRFGWDDLLIDGILVPAHQGRAIRYRPPKWYEHGREGSLEVPAGCPLLIIEGDGAGRREVAHLIDTLIWVQADEREVARRAADRAASPPAADLANNPVDGTPFDEDGWMADEIPFNAAQRTWERADIIVCGTPETPHDPSTEIVISVRAPERAEPQDLLSQVATARHVSWPPGPVLSRRGLVGQVRAIERVHRRPLTITHLGPDARHGNVTPRCQQSATSEAAGRLDC